ncbi:alpha/beta hydrolase [Rhodoplanes roseus]|uniref:Alpha/beta hydrolase n=1 Tax=Rhodoplanes roseus TaxID=29409 RepID=A0A327L0N6_9BRAD|nr:alpha/beta hydrolase [Rhodoplanes roseus]RAI43505.1 alpha/beta hydrolase [Rhodoplanes roseus]
MTVVVRLAIAAAVVYAGVVLALYVAQRSLMYLPETRRTAPAAAGLPEAEEIEFVTADGERLLAWHIAPRESRPVILYLHGNGGALRHRARRFAALARDGFGLLAVSYRGFGGSTGSPTETGLLADADAAYAFLTARYGAGRIVVYGESLGTGVAVALAASRPVARVILMAPYTSTADVARLAYPFVPIGMLMKDQYRSDQRAAAVAAPTLILHGTADTVIPIAFGEQLYALLHAPKRFVRFPGGAHEDLDDFGARDAVRDFLAGAPDQAE